MSSDYYYFKRTPCHIPKTIPIALIQTDLGVEVVMLEGVNRFSIQQHLALLRRVKVFQQTHTGALSTA